MMSEKRAIRPIDRSENEIAATRRGFLTRALTVTSGLALSGSLLTDAVEAAGAAVCPAAPVKDGVPHDGGSLPKIGEIKYGPDKTLRAVITVKDENRNLWTPTANITTRDKVPELQCVAGQPMRFFAGSRPGEAKPVWPTVSGVPSAAPTLRARVGGNVEITLLNQVDVTHFAAQYELDKGACSVSTELGTGTQLYPNSDTMPDCFHGSSSANLHFHGFHVSPSTVEDNVLVQVRPSPRKNGRPVVTEASVKQPFRTVFDDVKNGKTPKVWENLPDAYRKEQEAYLRAYDTNANEMLWPADMDAISAKQWPLYYVGAYPYGFHIPAWNGSTRSMGQSPGTHWYHAHKHGSTALNELNGMAGAFIIEGDYDEQLKKIYEKWGLIEQVLVLQQLGSGLNLLSSGGQKEPTPFVNGMPQPVLAMRPNEIQHWRIVNTAGQATIAFAPFTGINTVEWRQISQDGVQYIFANYNKPGNVNGAFTMSPGNRVDLLIKAPAAAGKYDLKVTHLPFPGPTTPFTLLTINVQEDPKKKLAPGDMMFPATEAGFPRFPDFLKDVSQQNPITKPIRNVVFNTNRPGQPRVPPAQTINGKKFEEDQEPIYVEEGTSEEWNLVNSTTGPRIDHPFHIHINPFQVVEVFDPRAENLTNPNAANYINPVTARPEDLYNLKPKTLPQPTSPYIWWDVIGIPAALAVADPRDSTKTITVPGHVRIQQQFVDFTGTYVIHCHILAHEDRGMMQLVTCRPKGDTTPISKAAVHHH